MPEYRWGIFLAERDQNRQIAFGDNKGKPAWQDVPGEHRSTLRRLIVTQGDTEPASVEQQRLLGKTAPSLYDLRNLFQINVEEGRHLWAMVYLLHAYFGRDGREEAEAMLERHSGDPDKPRILGAFNEETPDWLSFFMFTFFTDRDGKYQLASLAESGFDPLARSCRFMLTEEAHHMFVGETGVGRIIQRTCELMKEHKTDDVRALGAIDLPTMQKYLNFHFSVSLDLFGQEASTNAANYYTQGVKGRYLETRIGDDHLLVNDTYEIETIEDGRIVKKAVPALQALNERLRQDYIEDCARGVGALEQGHREGRHQLRDEAAAPRLRPPHRRLRRSACLARRQATLRSRVEGQRKQVAADRRRPRLHHVADGPGRHAARQVRPLDRSARARHQQPARRFRVCKVQLGTVFRTTPKLHLPVNVPQDSGCYDSFEAAACRRPSEGVAAWKTRLSRIRSPASSGCGGTTRT
jgi:1,2-phenylacetyl-CoA epoxidase catalytic subunit